jgi:3-oxoacyl-[acyl-carrier protein] reductase
MMKVQAGRVAIVTGAGRGIGKAIAMRLASEGASVVVNDVDSKTANETAVEIASKCNVQTLASTHDISKKAGAEALVETAFARFGRIDVLVNNAGVIRDAMTVRMTEQQWDVVMDVDLKGPFLVGQACLKKMQEAKFGRIINISSTSAQGNVGQSNYSAAKAGLVGLTKVWALEFAKKGITCNAIGPGPIATPMTDTIPENIKAKFNAQIPVGRFGRPEDIANGVAYFANPDNSFVTGQFLKIDGGFTTSTSSL